MHKHLKRKKAKENQIPKIQKDNEKKVEFFSSKTLLWGENVFDASLSLAFSFEEYSAALSYTV